MATYNGTSGADSITGTTGDDTVISGGGNDTVNTGDGNDTVWTGDGNDLADGGSGNDALAGDKGNDTLSGNTGSDTVVGGQGADSLSGGADGDLLLGDGQWYTLTPSTGGTSTQLTVTNLADGPIYLHAIDSSGQSVPYATIQAGQTLTVPTGTGDNWVLRDENNYYLQEIFGAANQTVAYGLTTSDTLDGGAGNDTIFGQYGDDLIIGGTGNDSLSGGAGTDSFQIGAADGVDTIAGGETAGDADTLSFSTAATGVAVTFSGSEAGTYGIAGGGSGTFSQIETIAGTSLADRINATAASSAQNIRADAGSDTVTGGAGNDSIDAGNGDDTVSGGSGSDTVTLGDGNDTFGTWGADAGNDLVYGGAGNDSIIGGGDDDTLYGEAGADTLSGGGGSDNLSGGADADVFAITDDHGYDNIDGGETGNDWDTIWFANWISDQGVSVTFSGTGSGSYSFSATNGNGVFNGIEATGGTVYADTLNAAADGGGVALFGDGGADTLTGGSGADWLDAGTGDDSVTGGGGADTLTGGDGNDSLSGGAGSDVFRLTSGGGSDRITDFDRADSNSDGMANDRLDVSGLTDAAGSPVTRRDVTIGRDAQGNAVLQFPNGETVVLQGISPEAAAAPGQLFAMGIPCFARGTRIAVPGGTRPVEEIVAGMLVLTRDHGPQPVIWAGGRRIGARQLAARPELRPVVIPPGPFGNRRPLTVSPQHAVLLRRRPDEAGQFVRARHLAARGDGTAHVAAPGNGVAYHHLLLRRHEVIWAEGVATESLYPGRMALLALGRRAQSEIRAIVCGLAGTPACTRDITTCYGPRARPLLGRKEALAADTLCPWLAPAGGGAAEVTDRNAPQPALPDRVCAYGPCGGAAEADGRPLANPPENAVGPPPGAQSLIIGQVGVRQPKSRAIDCCNVAGGQL